jgi:hypothetical protein
MVEIKLPTRKVEGMPLAWGSAGVHLLARDGRLWHFAPDEIAGLRQTADRFRGYTAAELRSELLRELGGNFEISGTTHYLVAHPAGERDRWADRFEELYGSFVHYFSVRGIQLQAPPFPLVGIVCPNRREFLRYAAEQGVTTATATQGFYCLKTNRIIVYDLGGKGGSRRWQENAAVIIHEATHQTAFNTGVHSRHARPPLWVVEGLATMFEAPGVHNARMFPNQSDRINQGRLDNFRRLAPQHKPELLRTIIAEDRLFQLNPQAAYAEAWALTFFLVETMPRKYAQYLRVLAKRPPFAEYSPSERTSDFVAVFGHDWRMLDAQLLRFIATLR